MLYLVSAHSWGCTSLNSTWWSPMVLPVSHNSSSQGWGLALVQMAPLPCRGTIARSNCAPIHSTEEAGIFSFSSFSPHWWQILCGKFLTSCSVIKFLSSKQTGQFSILSVHNENHFWWYGMQWEWDRAGFSLVMWCNVRYDDNVKDMKNV